MILDTIAVIPARYSSSRFPGKPLIPLIGKPMIIWVAELTARVLGAENVFVATDDIRIEHVVKDFGFKVAMTSSAALTGTDRVWEVAQQVDSRIYLNIQGDEPLIDPDDILKIREVKNLYPEEVINGMCPLKSDELPENKNIPKVVATENNRLLYMSRLPIPGTKAETANVQFWKQVCIYAFSKSELQAFGSYGRKGKIESLEDIEILRFLELNIPVRMVETCGSSYAIDVPQDVPFVERVLRNSNYE